MKHIISLVEACLLGMLFLCLGLYLGTENERKQQASSDAMQETVSTIAVVNLDEGSDADGEKINYGSELGMFPNESFVGASLEEAKRGITNGTYGAYIIIPPTFSESVESINDFPKKAEITYAINPNLSDATKLTVTDYITDYYATLNDTLSYVYVTSIMEEFHEVQDGSKIILEHDIEDLNNILAIVPAELSEDIEYTELEKTNYEWEYMDLSEYCDNNIHYIDNIDTYYEEVNEKMLAKYKEITDGAVQAAGNYKEVISKFDSFEPFKDKNGNDVLDEGFTKLETEAALTDDASIKYAIDNKVSEQAQIEMGYYREILQQYVDRELARYVKAQEIRLSKGQPIILPQINSQAYTDEYNSLGDADELSADEVNKLFVLNSFEPKTDSGDPDKNAMSIGEAYPVLVKEELNDEEKEQKEAIVAQLKKNTIVSDRFKHDTFDIIVPTREKIKDIIAKDIVEPAKQNMLDQLADADKSLDDVSAEIAEEYEKIHTYNPLSEISSSTAKENVSALRNEIMDMQMAVNEKTMNDTTAVNDIYLKSEENIRSLMGNMKTANDATKTNVQNTIDTLKAAREGINTENSDILEAFSERLSYTRLGTLENEQAYDFIVQPVENIQEIAEKTIVERIQEDNTKLIVIMVICGVLYLAVLISRIIYEHNKRVPKATVD